MLNNQSQVYTIYKPQITTDSYNQEITEWEEVGTERLVIGLNSHKSIASAGLFMQQCEWIAVGSSLSPLDVGWRIDKYEVVFVVTAGRQKFYYLKDYGRNND